MIKVMHILTVNISQLVSDRANMLLATNIKLHVGFRLANLHLTLANGQRQVHQHLDCE